MALHQMVADCSQITERGMKAPIIKIELTADEEKSELERWAMEDAKQKAYVRPPRLEDIVAGLQTQVKELQNKMGVA